MNKENLSQTIDLTIDGLYAMAVHGSLRLALRHPAFTGPSRELVLHFVDELEKAMKAKGIFTDRDVKAIHKVENEESPHTDLGEISEGP